MLCVYVCMHVCLVYKKRVFLFLDSTGTSLSQCSDAVSANVGHFGAGEHRVKD